MPQILKMTYNLGLKSWRLESATPQPSPHLKPQYSDHLSCSQYPARMGYVQENPEKGGEVCLYGQTGVVVRRGPGIAFHIGTRVRDGHHKGPGGRDPNQT